MILFPQPVLQEYLWGGTNLIQFGYDTPNNSAGECWVVSARKNGPNVVLNGKHKGKSLKRVWNENKALFGNDSCEDFPLLTRILDAHDCLSIRAHPDNEYALKYEGEYGKTECWYILDAQPGVETVYGVNATNRSELERMIDHHQFDYLSEHALVKPGDFFYASADAVHVIGSGILILEARQSPDVTYHIYDYDRRDKNGHARELHLNQSKDAINITITEPNIISKTEAINDNCCTQFVANHSFMVEEWSTRGVLDFQKPHTYCLVSMINGHGQTSVNNRVYKTDKGDHFILTSEDQYIKFVDNMNLIVSFSKGEIYQINKLH